MPIVPFKKLVCTRIHIHAHSVRLFRAFILFFSRLWHVIFIEKPLLIYVFHNNFCGQIAANDAQSTNQLKCVTATANEGDTNKKKVVDDRVFDEHEHFGRSTAGRQRWKLKHKKGKFSKKRNKKEW